MLREVAGREQHFREVTCHQSLHIAHNITRQITRHTARQITLYIICQITVQRTRQTTLNITREISRQITRHISPQIITFIISHGFSWQLVTRLQSPFREKQTSGSIYILK